MCSSFYQFFMDTLLPFLFHLAVLLLPLSLLLLAYKRIKSPHNNVKLPPGTKGWPFIGETLEFVMACRQGQPQKFINDRVRKYSQDIFRTSLFGENMAVFCGAAGNKLLFTNEAKYVKAWLPGSISKIISDPKGDIHVKPYDYETPNIINNILPEFLRPQALKSHIPIMDSTSREQLKMYWSPYDQVKVHPLAKKFSFELACRLFMGIRDPDIVKKLSVLFSRIASGMFSVPINFPGTPYHNAVKGRKAIAHELKGIIERRKLELSEKTGHTTCNKDLLTEAFLFKDANGRSLDETHMDPNLLSLLFASHDTIGSTITFVLKFLGEHPDVYRKVYQEQMAIAKSKDPNELLNWDDIQKMKYSWCVACETMRLLPPAQGTFREAITDFTAYEGFTIPKGWKIYWTVHSTHKNPKYFKDPEKFDPSRFERNEAAPYSFVPFGGGPHMCPGKEYARLAILTFIHNLVTRFKWKKVVADERIVVEASPVPVHGFPIHLEPLN